MMERLSNPLIFWAILFCAGLAPVIEAAVKIITPTTNQIIKYRNQSVLFNCTLTSASSSGANFLWFKDNSVIQPVHRKNSPFWSSFELKNFSAQDEGKYLCIHGQSHDSVIVLLAAKPKTSILGDHSRIVASDASPYLRCEAVGWPRPTIFWMKDNKNISNINENNQYQEKPVAINVSSIASTLTILMIQRGDGGVYTCVGMNALGVDKRSVSVRVPDGPARKKPKMTAEKPRYTVEVGKDASLVCHGEQVKDSAFTFLVWEFNGTKLKLTTSSDHYKVKNTFYKEEDEATPKVKMQLTIIDVGYADAGDYSCVVKSDREERASDNMTLEVREARSNIHNDGMKVWMLVVLALASFLLALSMVGLMFVMWRWITRKRLIAKRAKSYGQDAQDIVVNDMFPLYSTRD